MLNDRPYDHWSMHGEQAVGKIQYPFLIKTSMAEIISTFCNLIKAIYRNQWQPLF